MRKTRANPPNRCYHLISRVAHRAFFLDNDEKTRLVDLIRRVAALYLRTSLGIASREYFTKVYLRPLAESGLIVRTNPDHPNSPRQKYRLTEAGQKRIRKVAPL